MWQISLPWRSQPACRLVAVVCLAFGFFLQAGEAGAARVVKGNETWSGKVVLDGDVRVPEGTSLTLKPGTELLFPANAGFSVSGRLKAQGTRSQPITLRPVDGGKSGLWQGLAFGSSPGNTELSYLAIEGAVQSLFVSESSISLVSSTISKGDKGVVSGNGARVKIEHVTIRDMNVGAVEASVRAQLQIIGCNIENVSGYGIQSGQQAVVLVRENRISHAKLGVIVAGDFPPLEKNVIDNCEIGIGVSQASPKAIIRGNQVSRAKKGIACNQFAWPTLEGNTIEDSEIGIECFQGASPAIRNNRLARNKQALVCVQMCNPEVTRNEFADNQTAIYLHLSSYARIHENNFERNRLHVELDNMSYDWEVRAGNKPLRNRQKQNEMLAQQGRAAPETMDVVVDSEGYVNAKDNYWGEETTREIEKKGTAANISALKDGFDVPKRSYEGWPGEYLQDRIRYDGWKKAPVAGVGPSAVSPTPRRGSPPGR